MLKKTLRIGAIILILFFAAWMTAGRSYVEVLCEINEKKAVGEWQAVAKILEDFRGSFFSYPIHSRRHMINNLLRLKYNEGVASVQLGDFESAQIAFEQAATSSDTDIDFASRYNLAFLAIGRGEF